MRKTKTKWSTSTCYSEDVYWSKMERIFNMDMMIFRLTIATNWSIARVPWQSICIALERARAMRTGYYIQNNRTIATIMNSAVHARVVERACLSTVSVWWIRNNLSHAKTIPQSRGTASRLQHGPIMSAHQRESTVSVPVYTLARWSSLDPECVSNHCGGHGVRSNRWPITSHSCPSISCSNILMVMTREPFAVGCC